MVGGGVSWMVMGCGQVGWINRVLKSRKNIELWCTSTENSNDCINIIILQQLRSFHSSHRCILPSDQNPGPVQQQVIDYNFMLS